MEKVVFRTADITPKEARDGLKAAYPGFQVASFTITPDGTQYEAKIVNSEFPPKTEDDSDSAPTDGPPVPPVGDESDDSDDDSGDDSGAPKPPKKDEGEGKGGSIEHSIRELTHLVHLIADAVGVTPGGGPDDMGPGGPPVPGDDPGAAGGPMPPAADPLPPPAKPGGGAPGGGPLGTPFSKVASERRSFVVWREPDEDGTLPPVSVAAAEIRASIPSTHKLAQITLKRGKIDGGEATNVYIAAITKR